MTSEEQKQADTKTAVVVEPKTAAVVVLVGVPGGPFNIRGSGFGPSGSLTVGGKAITTISRWDDKDIRGTLPKDTVGEVVLQPSNSQTAFRGHYPTKTVAKT